MLTHTLRVLQWVLFDFNSARGERCPHVGDYNQSEAFEIACGERGKSSTVRSNGQGKEISIWQSYGSK